MTPIGLALRAALDSFDDEGDNKEVTVIKAIKEDPMQTTKPRNISKETFDYIIANPGCTPSQVANALQKVGYLHKTVTALIYQMVRQDMLRKDVNKKVYALLPTYVPIKTIQRTKPERRKKVNVERVGGMLEDAGLASLATRTRTQHAAPQQAAPQKLTAKYILDNVSLSEAKALYDEMHAIFGRAI
jgi:tRNA splicing ligase